MIVDGQGFETQQPGWLIEATTVMVLATKGGSSRLKLMTKCQVHDWPIVVAANDWIMLGHT